MTELQDVSDSFTYLTDLLRCLPDDLQAKLGGLYPGGRLFLYTGTPVIDGIDRFLAAVRPRLEALNCKYTYEEIDPDVFGEELDSAPYDRADRIAVVALTVHA